MSASSFLSIPAVGQTFLGFDRNEYPGDQNLKELRKTFSYTGYWLNNPPAANTNSWVGKRAKVEDAGFGFLVLFNGRLYAELKSVARAIALGQSDAQIAAAAARREGFPEATIIFLDRSRAGAFFRNKRRICSFGSIHCAAQVFAPVSTVQGLQRGKTTARPSSLSRTSDKMLPDVVSPTG